MFPRNVNFAKFMSRSHELLKFYQNIYKFMEKKGKKLRMMCNFFSWNELHYHGNL